jgi:hypothetical protein
LRLLVRGLTLLALAASPARAAVQDAEAALADADTYTVLIRTTVRYPFGETRRPQPRLRDRPRPGLIGPTPTSPAARCLVT